MKKIIITTVVFSVVYAINSCGTAETKADISDTLKSENVGTKTAQAVDSATTPVINKNNTVTVNNPATEKNGILSQVDNYLVSHIDQSQGALVIENKLSNIFIQKAVAEVVFTRKDGSEAARDYYIIENIEPKSTKAAKLKVNPESVTATIHIVKLKCDELTDGALILVGAKYSPK